jgi:hypothetical protein
LPPALPKTLPQAWQALPEALPQDLPQDLPANNYVQFIVEFNSNNNIPQKEKIAHYIASGALDCMTEQQQLRWAKEQSIVLRD